MRYYITEIFVCITLNHIYYVNTSEFIQIFVCITLNHIYYVNTSEFIRILLDYIL